MSQVTERTRTISVTKLHPVIGAEIRGVDLSLPLGEETLRQIKDAWHEHAVLLFRDQDLGEDDQRRFASHFGPVAKRVPPKPGAKGAADALEWDDMMMISDHVDANGKALGSLGHGEMWFHTDKCYHRRPHRATFLYGIEIPSEGGHTQFSSMYAAYENLPADLKRRLAGAMVIQGQQYGVGRRIDITLPLESTHHCAQPIFVTNPGSSSRTALYVASQNSMWIDGMDRDESEVLLQQLFAIAEDPAIIYRARLAGRRSRHVGQSRVPARAHRLAERTAPNTAPLYRVEGEPPAARQTHETRYGMFVKHSRRMFSHLAVRAVALPLLPRMAWSLDYPTRPVRVLGLSGRRWAGVIARLVGQRLSERLGRQFTSITGRAQEAAWRPGCRGRSRGRLRVAVRRQRKCGERQPLSEPAFQFRARHRGRRHDLQRAVSAGGQSGDAGENPLGVHRLREGESSPDQYGVARCRNHAPPHVRAVEDDDGHRTGSRTLSDGYIPDLLSGQVQVAFSTITQAIAYVRDGRLRVLAVSSATRSEVLPDVPAVGESVPGYDASGWFGICAPAATPTAIIDKLNNEINAIVGEPDTRGRLVSLGVRPLSMTSAQFGKLIGDDTEKWAKVVRSANIKIG